MTTPEAPTPPVESPSAVLRRAAGLMLERAEAATPGKWQQVTSQGVGISASPFDSSTLATTHHRSGVDQSARDAAHVASWHPAVAVKVATSLEQAAAILDEAADGPLAMAMRAIAEPLVDVARAYLGERA